jgi:hypothetical protein
MAGEEPLSKEALSSPSDVTQAPAARIAVVACAVLETEVRILAADLPQVVRIEVLEQGIHTEPDKLRQQVLQAIDRIENDFAVASTGADPPPGIALVYGLCSRGVEGVRTRRSPLALPRAHDCITILLGDKERYARYVAENPGTYWYSHGWIATHSQPGQERYDRLYRQYREKFGEEDAKYLMETEQHWFKTYTRATFVDLTIGATPADVQYTQECAKWLGWNYDLQRGDPALLRDLLAGQWDNDRFLVLKPGETLAVTADERIVKAVPAPDQQNHA